VDSLLTSKEATVKKVMDLREKIRKITDEIQRESVQRRKTVVIMFSTSKYNRTMMKKAEVDFDESRNRLAKMDTELSKLLHKLYDANCEYQEAHGIELVA